MIKLKELKNGNLLIILEDRDEFDILMDREFNDERHYLVELLDTGGYIGNNWDALFNIGLTEAPAIGYGAIYKDEEADEPCDWEKLWWYPDYMVSDYLKTLDEKGEVEFIRAT